MAIFLIVGAFFYGFDLKEITEEIRKAQQETGKSAAEAKGSELSIHELKNKVAELKNEVARSAQDSSDAAGEVKKGDSTAQIYRGVQDLVEGIRSSSEEARTLVAQIGQLPAHRSGSAREQAERLVERKILTIFRNVLPGDQYAKLEEEFRSAIPKKLRRAIYDAEHHKSLPGKLVRSEGGPATGDPVVTQVYDNIGITYNFFYSAFGRNISGDIGATIMATVHYGQAYDNAFWNGKQLVIGDGDGIIFKTGSFRVAVDCGL